MSNNRFSAEDACWLFWKFYHKQLKGINVRRFKNFDNQRKDVINWLVFEKLASLANQLNIDLREYIPLVCKKYDKFFQPKVLLHPSNLEQWKNRNVGRGKALEAEKIAIKFITSVHFVVKFCKENNLDSFGDYLTATIQNNILGLQIASGKLSKYFLCMLPPVVLDKINKAIEPDIANQLYNMVIKNREALCSNTIRSMKEMKGVELSSVVNLVDKNIQKNRKT